MTSASGDADSTLAPDDAFAVLGNDTRMAILRAVGEADDPVTFSALRDATGVADSGQFNYHLDKLVGHFVIQTEDGYALTQAGRRVMEAVLSGAVTEAPRFEVTTIDEQCQYCGAPIAVGYSAERVWIYCTECEGTYSDSKRPDAPDVPDGYGYLGTMLLPPAGVEGRSPADAYRAAWTWANIEILAMASGVCPRCSADIETEAVICNSHDPSEGLCESCGRRHAVFVSADCTNCTYRIGGGAFIAIATQTPVLRFLLEHGINPVDPDAETIHRMNRIHEDYDEELLGTDPLRLRVSIEVDGDALTLTVDEDLTLTAVED